MITLISQVKGTVVHVTLKHPRYREHIVLLNKKKWLQCFSSRLLNVALQKIIKIVPVLALLELKAVVKLNFFVRSLSVCGPQLDDDGSDTVWCQNKPLDVTPLKHEHSLKGSTLPPTHIHTPTCPMPHAYIMLHTWSVLKTCHFVLFCLEKKKGFLVGLLCCPTRAAQACYSGRSLCVKSFLIKSLITN